MYSQNSLLHICLRTSFKSWPFLALISFLITPFLTGQSSTQDTEQSRDVFAELAAKIKPSVVTISSTDRGGGTWGVGTGFVVDSAGIIATNFHVIGEHREFVVERMNGQVHKPLEILAIDRSLDLALIRIDQDGLPALSVGDSDKISPGQSVLSIGNPLGYGLSVSQGVISAVRELEFGDGRPMIQVAIPIEAGSSGSPVVNLDGEVLSILTIKSGGAIGFGIPSNALRSLMDEKNPIPIERWYTIGMLDEEEWSRPMGGNWRQRAGIIKASGMGTGFGGRMICLSRQSLIKPPYDLEVDVLLEDESGAAGLVFAADGEDRHYGFYPTNGSLRLTCFNGPVVFDWEILETVSAPEYLPGQWNRLNVRFDEDGHMRCMVNGKVVIEETDFNLINGFVGLCKFREPGAEFRNFRMAARIPRHSISNDARVRAHELSESLILEEAISPSDLESLTDLGGSIHQALIDRADEMEAAGIRLRESAEKLRISLITRELSTLLNSTQANSHQSLLRSALLVSKLDNPHFHLEHYLKRVDRLAERISGHFPPHATNKEKITLVIEHLFNRMGYHGSTLDFHHRSNSYINEVIEDREGLPITLCLLLMEIGKRVDLPISGIATPGHFLALYREPDQGLENSVIIDAFGGRAISAEQANKLTSTELSEADFSPASAPEIVSRILRNLLRSAEWDRDSGATLRYLNALVAINPEDRYNRALRAMTNYGLGHFEETLNDITILIGSNRDDPSNAALIEIEQRLLKPHRNRQP